MPANFNSDVQIEVSVAFNVDALQTGATWTDISKYVRFFDTERLRSRVLDATQPGYATITLDNRDARFDPNNTGSPYSPNLKVNKRVRIRAIHNSITYDLFRGFVQGWPQRYPELSADATVTIELVDGFRGMSQFEDELTESQETSGTRIGNLLDAMSWPAGWRDIDAGTHNIAALDEDLGSILGQIQNAELVEQGWFWIAGNGDATFRDGDTRIEDQDTSNATFGDVASSDLAFANPLEITTDMAHLWNDVHVTRKDGTEQSSVDSASVADYGTFDLHLSDTLHVADGEALALADWLSYQYSDPEIPRVPEITLLPQKDPTNLWPEALGREFLDRITVKKRTDGDNYNSDFHISGIMHSVEIGERWETTFQLDPVLADNDWWILGTSELGVDTRLGY